MILLHFCLVLGLIWLSSCVLAPAAVVSSAAISAAALLAEIEDLAQEGDKSASVTVIVDADVDVYEGPGKNYSLKGTLHQGDQFKAMRRTGDWVQCLSDEFEIGWVQNPKVPKL